MASISLVRAYRAPFSEAISENCVKIGQTVQKLPILLNVLKSDTNKRDIMGYNKQWSFSMEFYSKSSKLP